MHGIDSDAIIDACGKVLSETALEQVIVKEKALGEVASAEQATPHWSELWPTANSQNKH